MLPEKFTLPQQLQNLYEGIFGTLMDKRNFSRKVLSTGLLIKQKDKERLSSANAARSITSWIKCGIPDKVLCFPQFLFQILPISG